MWANSLILLGLFLDVVGVLLLAVDVYNAIDAEQYAEWDRLAGRAMAQRRDSIAPAAEIEEPRDWQEPNTALVWRRKRATAALGIIVLGFFCQGVGVFLDLIASMQVH